MIYLILMALLVGGLLLAGWAAMGWPSVGDFLARPICYVVGHDLTRPLWESNYEGHPCVVWVCSRHDAPVTVLK